MIRDGGFDDNEASENEGEASDCEQICVYLCNIQRSSEHKQITSEATRDVADSLSHWMIRSK